MSTWNPSDVPVNRLTADEKAAIQSRLPATEEGQYFADAVFEGGGVKGTAFLGALRCFDDAGIQFRKVAGTSAGAITAALVGAGLTVDTIEAKVGQLDYLGDLLSQKTSRWIWNGTPEDDLSNPIWMLANLFLARQLGQYSSKPFKDWLQTNLPAERNTFAAFMEDGKADSSSCKVVISDISRGEMVVLPDDLQKTYGIDPANFSLAEAVRLSMSIPLFFAPETLGGSVIVDGGILSNFPLWIYDAPPGVKPKCPTFGFQLVEPGDGKARQIEGVGDLLIGVLATMQSGRDRRHQRLNDEGRIINIGTLGISTTKFNLTNEDKSNLYREGYEATRKFLLETWDWQKHLTSRGFTD